MNFTLKLKKLLWMSLHPRLYPLTIQRIAPSLEHRLALQRYACNCDFVVDVGANVGQFLLASLLNNKELPVYSFEPHQESFLKLQRVSKLYPKTTVFNLGLSDKSELIPLNILSSHDSSSFLQPSSLQLTNFNQRVKERTEGINVVTLDSLIGSLNTYGGRGFLKVDVQGFELNVLLGAKSFLEYYIKYVYVELSLACFYEGQPLASQIIGFLANENFTIIGIFNPYMGPNGNILQADFLFEKKVD